MTRHEAQRKLCCLVRWAVSLRYDTVKKLDGVLCEFCIFASAVNRMPRVIVSKGVQRQLVTAPSGV